MRLTIKRATLLAAVAALMLLVGGAEPAAAQTVYVIDNGLNAHQAQAHLQAGGFTVVRGAAQSSYAGYSQVWDLRYNATLSGTDVNAFNNLLNSGGGLYLTGEHSGFAARNASVQSYVQSIGGGAFAITPALSTGQQFFTSEGQGLNQPAPVPFIRTAAGSLVASATAGTGFVVTHLPSDTSRGSIVAWDFGDLSAQNARLLVGLDVNIFETGHNPNAPNMTRNFATWLGADAPVSTVPEPTSALLFLPGLAAIGLLRRRRQSEPAAA